MSLSTKFPLVHSPVFARYSLSHHCTGVILITIWAPDYGHDDDDDDGDDDVILTALTPRRRWS